MISLGCVESADQLRYITDGARDLFVRVSPHLLADLMHKSYFREDGTRIVMEGVYLYQNEETGEIEAEPRMHAYIE